MKTNVMRILDKEKIEYKEHIYADTDAVSGTEVVKELGINPAQLFKTLVTEGKSKEHYVFLVPVDKSLDMKKARNLVDEKSMEMLKSKDLMKLVGYEHGGCSPLGMKKNFVTIIDESVTGFETIMFNAGKIGYMVELKLADLDKVLNYKLADITRDED